MNVLRIAGGDIFRQTDYPYLVRPVKIGAYLHTCLRKEIRIFEASNEHKAL